MKVINFVSKNKNFLLQALLLAACALVKGPGIMIVILAMSSLLIGVFKFYKAESYFYQGYWLLTAMLPLLSFVTWGNFSFREGIQFLSPQESFVMGKFVLGFLIWPLFALIPDIWKELHYQH